MTLKTDGALTRIADAVSAREGVLPGLNDNAPEKPKRPLWANVRPETCPAEYRETDVSDPRLDRGLVDFVMGIEPKISDWRGLGLMGDSGIGKTRMAFVYARALYEQGMIVRYVTHADFAVLVTKAFTAQDGRLAAGDKLERLRRVPLLVLDDIGSGANTPRATEQLQSLLESRTSNGRPTVWTSECDSQGLEEFFGTGLGEKGAAIVRRLVQPEFTRVYTAEGEGDE